MLSGKIAPVIFYWIMSYYPDPMRPRILKPCSSAVFRVFRYLYEERVRVLTTLDGRH